MEHQLEIDGKSPLRRPAEAWQVREHSGDRLLMVYRVARVYVGSDHGLARVLDMSDDALMLETRLDMSLGDTLTIDLSDDCTLVGRVVWRDTMRCGLRFNEPIDCAGVLNRLYEDGLSGEARQVRLPVTKSVVVNSGAGMQVARLRDVSQRGIKLTHDGCFRPGLSINVLIAPGVERAGVVRWTREGLAEIVLTEPLSVNDLESINSI